jgi:hypothetical protein
MSPLLPGIIASGISGHLFTPEGSAYEIASYTAPSGGVASITFAIPSGYRHIELQGIHRSDLSGSGNNIGMYMRFNGDAGSNYYWHELAGNGSSAMAYGQSDTGINASPHGPRAGDTASVFNADVITILDYASTTKTKVSRSLAGDDLNGSGWIHQASGLWNNTSAITSITLFLESSNFVENSTFTLIGYK